MRSISNQVQELLQELSSDQTGAETIDSTHHFEMVTRELWRDPNLRELLPTRGWSRFPSGNKARDLDSITMVAEEIKQKIENVEQSIESAHVQTERINHYLAANNYWLATDYQSNFHDGTENEEHALVCYSKDINSREIADILTAAAHNVFLIGPSTQQYLFLPRDSRRSLFASSLGDPSEDSALAVYAKALAEAEENMPGFYAYDWLSVEPLLELFRQARDEDFAQAVTTNQYGDAYTRMLKEVNGLLYAKKVRPFPDITGVQFTMADDAFIDLEDLSRGELKRLMIYAWLRSRVKKGAIVLMDEVEGSFHPEWQTGIVRDLTAWSNDSQFLLATHSYELCEAVTPAHVRELDPTLRRET